MANSIKAMRGSKKSGKDGDDPLFAGTNTGA